MIFVVNASVHLWLPFYIFNAHEHRSPILAVLICLEFAISVFCVLITVKLCIYIWKIRVFHINMSILAIATLMQYLECFLAKWLITLHQIGFFPIPGVPPDKKYSNWWTDDPDSIVPIADVSSALPMFFGGFLLWHYLYSMILFTFSICVERTLATILSGNYERHKRIYISVLILAVCHFLSLNISYQTFTDCVAFVPTVIGCIVCVATSCLVFIVILLVNQKIDKVQSSTRSHHFYTLAFRFQVKENIKALKVAYRVVVCIGVYIVFLCFLLFTIFFNVFPSLNDVFIFLLENFIYLNPLVICSVIFYSIEPWQKALLRDFPLLATSSSSKRRKDHRGDGEHLQTTEVYFTQLQTSWRK